MSLNPSVTTRYNLGPVKPWVESAAYIVGPKFGVKTIYGWRASDPFPDHPSGHALDFMITSKAQGQAIADFLQANASALGVKYIIWNRQVWEASGKPVAGWHPYTSTDNPHTDHVHVTFNDQPGTGNATTSAVLAASGVSSAPSPECAWNISVPLKGPTCVFTKLDVRGMIALLLVGGSVIVGLTGIALMFNKSIVGTAVGTAIGKMVPVRE